MNQKVTLGFVILAHANLHRVEQLVRYLSDQNCRVCVHIDRDVSSADFKGFSDAIADLKNTALAPRVSCEWGSFSIVRATLGAVKTLLDQFPETTNVQLISGSCLPLRPVRQLRNFLGRHPETDFIESVSVENNLWVKDGLNEERFSLYFPFSWRKRRRLFDKLVDLQRALKINRKLPRDLSPHIGSQWWCLTVDTLRAILDDPRKPYFDSYFTWTWIPDESYFQSLARLHSKRVVSRSLTFAKFDYMGKPFVLYDDHFDHLQKCDSFFIRKVWAGADRLYSELLRRKRGGVPTANRDARAFEALFDAADDRRCNGSEGRFHQGRFPYDRSERSGVSPRDFTVFMGLGAVVDDFDSWVEGVADVQSSGRLFARAHVGNHPKGTVLEGNLPSDAWVRKRNPKGYLSNYLWMRRDQHQVFEFGFQDDFDIHIALMHDPRAHIVMIRHCWVLALMQPHVNRQNILINAQRYYQMEHKFLTKLSEVQGGARLTLLELDAVVNDPAGLLREASADLPGLRGGRLQMMPKLADLSKVEPLVRRIENEGLNLNYAYQGKQNAKGQDQADRQKPFLVT